MPARQDTPSVVVASGPRSAAESSWLRWLGLRLALPLVLSLVLFARLSPSPSRSSSDYPFKLEPHFSGQRMVAARDLAAGDFILHARPLLVLPSQFKSPSISAINDEIKGMLQGLELKKRNSFYGLSSAAKGDLPIEMGIVKTNGIDVGDGKVGVFTVVSRSEHQFLSSPVKTGSSRRSLFRSPGSTTPAVQTPTSIGTRRLGGFPDKSSALLRRRTLTGLLVSLQPPHRPRYRTHPLLV